MLTQDEKRALLKELQAGRLTLEQFKEHLAVEDERQAVIDLYLPTDDGCLRCESTGQILTQDEYDALPGHKITFNLGA